MISHVRACTLFNRREATDAVAGLQHCHPMPVALAYDSRQEPTESGADSRQEPTESGADSGQEPTETKLPWARAH
eukprot:366321-Chlamydomonas_euryale.AAC.7